MTAENRSFEKQRLWIFAATALLGVIAFRYSSQSPVWTFAALGGIALAVWHGALDTVLAEETMLPRFGKAWKLPFMTAYIVLVGFVLMVWSLAPFAALCAFLLYSAVHFGTEGMVRPSPLRAMASVATGFVPIAAACYWWHAQVESIFQALLGGQQAHADSLTAFAGSLLIPAVLLSLCGSFQKISAGLYTSALLATELLLFYFCSPIVAFAIFFCAWHTPEHMVDTSRDANGVSSLSVMAQHLKRGAVAWLCTLASLGAVAWFGRHSIQAYTGVVFVALSALTVPHMLLAALIAKRHRTNRTSSLVAQHGNAVGR